MSDEKLIDEIKERWAYADREWKAIREEGRTDMRYIAGDPWDPNERKIRDEAGRISLSLDELGQYVNQLINEVRAQKRGIKVSPTGNGANDATANFRANLIREIEYKSHAQQAYTTMFENTVQRSYGFARVNVQYVGDTSFEQEIRIEPIENPDLVTPDPNALKPDLSDMKYCFVHESWTRERFKREFPKADLPDYADANNLAGDAWFPDERRLYVREYWAIETKRRTLVLLPPPGEPIPGQPPQPPMPIFKDTIPKEDWERLKGLVLRERDVDQPYVCQRITNGLNILRKNDWKGKYIPIVGCFGKVLWLDEGGGSGMKRKIMSMVRLMRDPFMAYCYARTCEIEAMGGVPRSSFIGYKGQFVGLETEWQKANHEPVAFLEAHPTTEATGNQVLPLPQKQPWDPPIGNIEMAAESFRRAIQSASGAGFLPTQAQKRNEKSGVALKQIEVSAQKGSYHFIDHFEDALRQVGTIINDLIPVIYDTARDLHLRKPDDSSVQVRVNDPSTPEDESKQPIMTQVGDHDVTISTGPSFEDERQAASDFVDTLITARPEVFPLIASDAVKMKNLGPKGDALAEKLEFLQPPEMRAKKDGEQQIPPEVQQQLAQAKQMVDQAMQEVQKLQQIVQTDQVKTQATLQKAQIDAAAAIEKARIEAEAADKDREDRQTHEMAIKAAEAEEKRRLEEMKIQAEFEKLRLEHELKRELAREAAANARELASMRPAPSAEQNA